MPNSSQTMYQREYSDKMGDLRMNPGLCSNSMYPMVFEGNKPQGLAYTTTNQVIFLFIYRGFIHFTGRIQTFYGDAS